MPGGRFGVAAAGHVRVAITVEDGTFATVLKTLCRFAASPA